MDNIDGLYCLSIECFPCGGCGERHEDRDGERHEDGEQHGDAAR